MGFGSLSIYSGGGGSGAGADGGASFYAANTNSIGLSYSPGATLSGDLFIAGVTTFPANTQGVSNLIYGGASPGLVNYFPTGSLTETSSSVLQFAGSGVMAGAARTIQVNQASGSTPGFLSAADWTTFNAKQAAVQVGPFSYASFAQGATIFGPTLQIGVADTVNPGSVGTTTQSFIGNKSFLSNVAIGSTSPGYQLHVTGNVYGTSQIMTAGRVGVGSTSPGVLLDIGTAGVLAGVARIGAATSGAVTIGVTATTSNWTWTLPPTAGTNGFAMTTNGSGVANWTEIGSYSQSFTSGLFSSFPATGTYGDATTLVLAPGTYDMSAAVFSSYLDGVVTSTTIGIGTVTGNDSTGLIRSQSMTTDAGVTATNDKGYWVSNYRVTIGATTTYYLKVQAVFTVTAPKYAYRISAVRWL